MKKLVRLISAVMLGLLLTHNAKAIVSVSTDFDTVAILNVAYSYQIQATPDNGPAVFTLVEAPETMTLSATGLLEWTPTAIDQGGFVKISVEDNDHIPNVKSFYIHVSDAVLCDPDLVSYWKLDETGGITYADEAGGYDATMLAASGYEDTTGIVGNAVKLNSASSTIQYLNVPDVEQYDSWVEADSFSFSIWFKSEGNVTGKDQMLFARGQGPNDTTDAFLIIGFTSVNTYLQPRIRLRMNNTESDIARREYDVTYPYEVDDHDWHHFAVVYEGYESGDTKLKLYIDGSLYQTNTRNFLNSTDFAMDDNLCIGWWDRFISQNNTYHFQGILDEPAVYSRGLTASEISDIYNSGNPDPLCQAGNLAPIILTEIKDTTIDQNTAFSLDIETRDGDGDPVDITAPTKPDWLTLIGNTLSGEPDNADVGLSSVTLGISDGSIYYEKSFDITVNNVNDNPYFINASPPDTAREGVAYYYQFTADDIDVGDEAHLEATVLPSWLSFAPATGIIGGIPGNNDGDTTYTIRAYDNNGGETEMMFLIDVANENEAPVFTSTPVTTGDDYEDYEYQATATDGDGDDLTFSLDEGYSADWLSITSDGLLTGTPAYDNVGDNNVRILVSDGTVNVPQQFVISVGNTNDPPEFTSTPVTTVDVDGIYAYNVTATDVDEDDVLEFTINDLPEWLSFNESNVLSGFPTAEDVGTYNISIELSDGHTTVTQDFTITVGPVAVKQFNTELAKIYPNPATETIKITLKNSTPATIQIIDITGRDVLKEELSSRYTEMNISDLKPGLYFYRISTENNFDTGKLYIK